MLVKTLDECFDMPEDILTRYTFELDDYRDEYNSIIEKMSQEKAVAALKGHIHSLNIVTCKSKLKGIIEIIEEIVEESGKIVVFGTYKEPLAELESHFGKRCVKVVGGMSSIEKNRRRDMFTEDKDIQIFLGNYDAAGEGIDLSVSDDFLVINFPMTPKELNQAKFRCKHPEKMKHTRLHYTFCKDSIDEYIYDSIIIEKEKDINNLLHGGKDVDEREDIVQVLMKKLLKKDVIELVDDTVHEVDGVPVLFNGNTVTKNPIFHDNEMFNNSSSEMIIVDQKSLNLNGISDKIEEVKSYKDPVLNTLTPPPGF